MRKARHLKSVDRVNPILRRSLLNSFWAGPFRLLTFIYFKQLTCGLKLHDLSNAPWMVLRGLQVPQRLYNLFGGTITRVTRAVLRMVT